MQFHQGIGYGPFTIAYQYMSWLDLLLISQEIWWFKWLTYVNAVLALHHEPNVENTVKTERQLPHWWLLLFKQTNSESILKLLSVIYVVWALKPDLDYDLAGKIEGKLCLKFVFEGYVFPVSSARWGFFASEASGGIYCEEVHAGGGCHGDGFMWNSDSLAFLQKPKTASLLEIGKGQVGVASRWSVKLCLKTCCDGPWPVLCTDKGRGNRTLFWGMFFLPLFLPLVS